MLQEIYDDLEEFSSKDDSSTSKDEACKGNYMCLAKIIEVITREDQDDLLIEMKDQI